MNNTPQVTLSQDGTTEVYVFALGPGDSYQEISPGSFFDDKGNILHQVDSGPEIPWRLLQVIKKKDDREEVSV